MNKNVENVFKPCLYVFKFFGLYSLEIENENGKRKSLFGIVWSLIFLFYCMSNAIYGIIHRNVKFKNLLLTLTDAIEIGIAFISASVSVLYFIIMRKKVCFKIKGC